MAASGCSPAVPISRVAFTLHVPSSETRDQCGENVACLQAVVVGGTGLEQVLTSELEHAGYEAAARCLADDLDALVVHLRDPLRHRKRWRSTNLLERSLGEVRRRTKVIGRFPARPAASPTCGPCLTCSSATPATVRRSPTSTANTSDRIKYQPAESATLDEEVPAA
jgi:Transposase, Mutator family